MRYEFIEYEVVNRVARLTTNRPEQRNAQSRRLLEELDEAFATAAEDRGVNVIALFGSGEHFSGGHDLGSADELADREERPLQAGVRGRFDHSRQQFVERTMRWRKSAETYYRRGAGLLHFRRLDDRFGDGHHLRRERCDVSRLELPVF